jgi:hypothetical protein
VSSPLDWFGLPQDADERAIKRAYAARLKALRPEQDPVAFQQLHERYRHALAWRQAQGQVVEQAALATATAEDTAQDERRDDGILAPTSVPPPAERADRHHAPSPEGPSRAWSPQAQAADPRKQPPAAESPPPPRAADPQRLARMFIAYAQTCTPAQALAWLNGREELWSFDTKNRTGSLLLHALLREPQPIQAPNFDAAVEFFGLDASAHHVEPLQLEHLREHMHERHQLLHRYQPAVEAWPAEGPDPDAFLAWYCELAESMDQDRQAAALFVQPSLNRAEVRDRLAPALLGRLLGQPPALPQEAAALLIRHFGLVALATRRRVDISDLPARLHVRWLAHPANRNRLARQIATPGHHPSLAAAARLLRWGSLPFRWWRVLLLSLVPFLPTRLGGALWRTSAGVPARLEGLADLRSVKFWIGAATRHEMALPRLQIGAWRCLLLLLAAGVATGLRYRDNPSALAADYAMPLVFAGIAVLGCAYYFLHTSLYLWQRLPEQPATRRPLLRLAFIPMLCLAGAAVFAWFVAANGDWVGANLRAQWVFLPTLVLAWQRYRGRSPAAGSAVQIGRFGVYLLGIALFGMLSIPLATALVAMGFWGWDLFRHRKQVQWHGTSPR